MPVRDRRSAFVDVNAFVAGIFDSKTFSLASPSPWFVSGFSRIPPLMMSLTLFTRVLFSTVSASTCRCKDSILVCSPASDVCGSAEFLVGIWKGSDGIDDDNEGEEDDTDNDACAADGDGNVNATAAGAAGVVELLLAVMLKVLNSKSSYF